MASAEFSLKVRLTDWILRQWPGSQIAANIGWLLSDKLVRMGLGLFVGVWMARHLGPGQFGLLNYALSYLGLFIPLALLGLDQIVVRELVRDPSGRESTLGTAFVLKLAAGVTTFALASALIVALKPADRLMQVLVLLCGVTLVSQSLDIIDYWFQSQVRSKYVVVARNTGFLITTLVRIAIILAGGTVAYFAAAVALEGAIAGLGLLIALRVSNSGLERWHFSRTRAVSLLRESWPLILTGVAIGVYMRFDQIMLGEMIDEGAVGVYAAAVRISEIWYFVPAVIVSSAGPAILRLRTSDPASYIRQVQRLLTSLALMGYAVAIATTLMSGWAVRLLYGASYADAGNILAVHIWAGVFACLGVAQTMWLVYEGHVRFSMVSTLFGAAANIALNAFLIPQHGALGAAVATLLSYGIVVGCLTWFHPPVRPIGMMTFKALILRT